MYKIQDWITFRYCLFLSWPKLLFQVFITITYTKAAIYVWIECRWKLLMRVKYSIELLVRLEGIACQLFLQSPRAKWCTHFRLCKNSSTLQSRKANDYMSLCAYSTEIDVSKYKFLWPCSKHHLWSSTKCNFAFM